jgi:hypothetical protein
MLAGLSGAAVLTWHGYSTRFIRFMLCLCLCGIAVACAVQLRAVFLPRDLFFQGTDLSPVDIRYNPAEYDLQGTEAAVTYLQNRPGRLAVVDEGGFLVPMALRRAPWGPSGYYDQGLTYPTQPEALRAWENEFIAILDGREVDYIVAVEELSAPEEVPFRGLTYWRRDGAGLLRKTHVLNDYIQQHFQLAMESHGYQVYERKSP